jgi:methanogenic corrinoid protein MtbC1
VHIVSDTWEKRAIFWISESATGSAPDVNPVFYEVGKKFSENCLKIATEHAFTMFCEDLLNRLRQECMSDPVLASKQVHANLLVCATGNYHSLGVRFIEFFLRTNGIDAIAFYPGLPADEVAGLLIKYKPCHLGISLALPEHLLWLKQLESEISRLPAPPAKVILGGFVFRNGMDYALPQDYVIAPFDRDGLLTLFRGPLKSLKP